MNKSEIKEAEEKLKKVKALIEGELSTFAKKDKELKGDWDSDYPKMGNSGVGSQALEEAADQVEEYATILPVEHSLELRLVAIDSALEKIKKGKYGKCEKCGKDIDVKRLNIFPEAKFCSKCEKK